MAYKLIPSTFSEAGSSVKHMDTATAAEGLRLWNYLVNTYGMENPLAFDPTNKKQVKMLQLVLLNYRTWVFLLCSLCLVGLCNVFRNLHSSVSYSTNFRSFYIKLTARISLL